VPINIMLEDHTGNNSRPARMDEKASVAALIPAIITALKLPLMDNAGRPMTYHLSHAGRRLQENETLITAEVQPGDTLTIVPEMTAGASREAGPGLVELGGVVCRVQPIAGFPMRPYKVVARGAHVQVTLASSAWKQIWRQAADETSCEIGGILIGKVYQEKEQFLVRVLGALPATHTHAGAAFVTFTAQTWLSILAQRRRTPGLAVLGWYHSHPGMGIFLSASDEFIHRNYFVDQPWYLALVVDPVSGNWGTFSWAQGNIQACRPC